MKTIMFAPWLMALSLASTAARADEAHEQARVDCSVCVAHDPAALDDARLRGRGTTRVVIGAVVLSLGVVVGAASAAPYITGGYDGWKYGVSMDVVGLSMIGVGTAVLAVGAGDLAMARRPRVALSQNGLHVRF